MTRLTALRFLLIPLLATGAVLLWRASPAEGREPLAWGSPVDHIAPIPESDPGSAPASPPILPDGIWIAPFGLPLRVVEPFRAPAHRYGPGHRGIDIAASHGLAVSSPVGGTVSFSGDVAGRPVVSIRAPDGSLFSLEPVGEAPPAGTAVSAGDPLGTVGTGGHCDGSCVHLGIRVDDDYIDPMLRYLGRPRLLPW